MDSKKLDRIVSLAKDVVVLFRDSAIILLAVLLLAFPLKFNTILVEAGFEEGSVVGFKWKSKLAESNETLEKANSSLTALRKENKELLEELTKVKQGALDPSFKEKLINLQSQNESLISQTDAVQSIVLDTIESNDPLINKAKFATKKQPLAKIDYTVGLQTVGVENSYRKQLNEQILEKGYSLDPISYSYDSKDKPNWFASQPTVFYYSSSSRLAAEGLSQLMSRLTNRKFVVRRGAGLGVDPSKKHLTFFIHFIE